jgi:hypothetical protein
MLRHREPSPVLTGQGSIGKWIAISLADGGSPDNNTVYDTRAECVRHQYHEQLCAYVKLPPNGMTPREAEIYLKYHRTLYDAGFRLPDPEFQPPLMPLTARDSARQIAALTKKV